MKYTVVFYSLYSYTSLQYSIAVTFGASIMSLNKAASADVTPITSSTRCKTGLKVTRTATCSSACDDYVTS